MADTVGVSIKGIYDKNRLVIFICCLQRDNGSNIPRFFLNNSLFHKAITCEFNRLGMTYYMPVQPIGLSKVGLEALRRSDALFGEEGFLAPGAR